MTSENITVDLLATLSNGNIGALNVLVALANSDQGVPAILKLRDEDIKGPNIWIGFKDICNRDLKLFKDKLSANTLVPLIKKSPYYIK